MAEFVDWYRGLRLRRATLETATLTFREATPNSKALIMSKGIFETLLADIA
jgi:hypothetical protein